MWRYLQVSIEAKQRDEGIMVPYMYPYRVFLLLFGPYCSCMGIWLGHTTPDLHITAGFVKTGSDVPSLPVMSLKMKKIIGARLKPAVKDHITAGLWLEPAVFWRTLSTAGLSQEPTMIVLYHCWF